jgi:hypothetical protein
MTSMTLTVPLTGSQQAASEIHSFNRYDVALVTDPRSGKTYVWDVHDKEVLGEYHGHAHGDFHHLLRIHFTPLHGMEQRALTHEFRDHLSKMHAGIVTDAYSLHPIEA